MLSTVGNDDQWLFKMDFWIIIIHLLLLHFVAFYSLLVRLPQEKDDDCHEPKVDEKEIDAEDDVNADDTTSLSA